MINNILLIFLVSTFKITYYTNYIYQRYNQAIFYDNNESNL